MCACGLRVVLKEHACRPELHRRGEDLLLHAIVKVAREAVALFGNREVVLQQLGRAQFHKQLFILEMGDLGLAHDIGKPWFRSRSLYLRCWDRAV